MELENVQKVLDDFRDKVIKEAKKGMPRSSGALAQSLKSYVKESKNSIQISFTMDDYGWFQDEGVKGKDPSKVSPNAKITGQQAPNSQYKFGSGRYRGTWGSFVKSLTAWAKKKNIRKIVFIHGVGTGVLKTELHNYISNFDDLTIKTADFREYGEGATEVIIKNS